MNTLMAANWKMYKTRDQARETSQDLARRLEGSLPENREVLVIPAFTALGEVAAALGGRRGYAVGAQDFYPAGEGAFTGEISPTMLLDAGCTYALTGHSERRHVLGEDDAFVGRKTSFGLEAGLRIILCVGEKLEERRDGRVEAVLERQLDAGLADVPRDLAPEVLSVAYEPVWAIGTGEVAGVDDIAAAHAMVRRKLMAVFPAGRDMRILYGGSVKPENCSSIIALDNVDGVLVGGASLTADSFSRIVSA